jgi:hypothetical protein
VTFVDPSRNPLHDEASGLYHGDVPVAPDAGPILRPADDPDAFAEDHSADMAAATYEPTPGVDIDHEHTTDADVVVDGTEGDVNASDDTAYEDLTVEQLRPIARERGIAYSGISKGELVDALYDWDEQQENAAPDAEQPAG